MWECIVRVGPAFMVKGDELSPLPNLAKSWEWSEDGHQLTMHLIEGAKWSDGDPFDSEDIMFFWEDNILDPNVTPTNGPTADLFGDGTTLEALDAYTVRWTFKEAFPADQLFNMGYGNFCPGPAHMLKPQHPKYSDNTYEEYKNAYGPEFMNFPVMGAWVPVEYRADDIIVLRRNPYYWKVDEEGKQLPYLDELWYKLSTWPDRDVQAVAGSGDFSNLEQAESFVEALRRASEDSAPARLAFGERTIGYSLNFNYSANGWGEPDARAQAVRELNRNLDFRKAVTFALDRERLGQALVRGPFTAIYPGGLFAGTAYYDAESTAYYPYSVEKAKEHLAAAGLVDTDGNGFVNFPADTPGVGGQDVEITLDADNGFTTLQSLVAGTVAMLEQAGLRVIPNLLPSNQHIDLLQAGKFDWMIERPRSSLLTVIKGTNELAPVGARTSTFHRAPAESDEVDLLPFEAEMVEILETFMKSGDPAERAELMKRYQKLSTENVYTAGLTQFPGALIINKRFANVPSGAPVFLFDWAEENIIRERVFVPSDRQSGLELHPETLPGAPGA
jgi:peptide/nickel transport system substrate-binding protein